MRWGGIGWVLAAAGPSKAASNSAAAARASPNFPPISAGIAVKRARFASINPLKFASSKPIGGIISHPSTPVKQMFGLPNAPAAAPPAAPAPAAATPARPAAPARRRRIWRARNFARDSVDIGNPTWYAGPSKRISGALDQVP